MVVIKIKPTILEKLLSRRCVCVCAHKFFDLKEEGKIQTYEKEKNSVKDGSIGRNASLPLTTKRSITTNLKKKQQPKLPENQTTWNSNNQGFKETFIHTGRRGGDRPLCGEDSQQGMWERWKLVDLVLPHFHTGKQGGTTGSKTDHKTQGFSMGNQRLRTSGCKTL